jgi:arylsulfatase A-like enzyme
MRLWSQQLVCWLAVLSFDGVLQAQHKAHPNVLILMADDMRADAIGALGNELIRTPHLDQLVRRGQAFCRAYANNPVCVASRAEILTGCSSLRNGVFPGYSQQLDVGLVTWPQALKQAGYRTCYVGKWHDDGRPYERGFASTRALFAAFPGPARLLHEVDSFGRPVTGYRDFVFQNAMGRPLSQPPISGLTPTIDAKFSDAAIREIQSSDSRPFFLCVNFTAPHDPLFWPDTFRDTYRPEEMPLPTNFLPQHPFDNGSLRNRDELLLPPPRSAADVRRELAIYYAVISELDRQVGRVIHALDESGKATNTIIIFSSDHGLAKGSHGLLGKQNMYEHTVNVPLLVVVPNLARDVRRTALVQLADLYPTFCELVGIEIPSTVEARSFASVLRGETCEARSEVFGYFFGTQRMICTKRFKLIDYPTVKRQQLFDLQADPHEIHDLSGDVAYAEVRSELERRLKKWQMEAGDPVARGDFGIPPQ